MLWGNQRAKILSRVLSLAIGILVAVSTSPPVAAGPGVDELFKKPLSAKTWGQVAADFVGYDGFTKSYALVVGISEYTGGYDRLPASQDPIRVRDFLINEADFDYVHMLTDEKATYARIRQLMVNVFPSLVDKNDRFFFYWSGHGTQRDNRRGGQDGFLPLTTSKRDDFASMVSMGDIQRWDNAIQGRHVLFLLDACLSGLAGTTSKSDARQIDLSELVKPAHHLITAGTSDEETIAGDRWGGSVFTHAFLRAVSGAADTDSLDFPKDGVVSLFELIKHVREYVPREARSAGWEKSITPQLRDLGGSTGEFFFLADSVPHSAQGSPSARSSDMRTMGNAFGGAQPTTGHARETEVAKVPIVRQGPSASITALSENHSSFRDCDGCPEMVVIASGRFRMGSNFGPSREKPQLEKIISSPYALGRFEVTESEWLVCQRTGACRDIVGGATGRPVGGISWQDAMSYVSWLSDFTGQSYRLPSETEWEYAARAGTSSAYPTGPIVLPDQANFLSDMSTPSLVGQYAPNAFGLSDMLGNVWEWVADCAASYTSHDTAASAIESADCDLQVLRGGGWRSKNEELRSANRYFSQASQVRDDFGLRVARDLAKQEVSTHFSD